MRLKDKIVLITGSTRGIGKDIATAFAAEGATVVITGRNAEQVQKVCQEMAKNKLKADGFACDVTNLQNMQEIVDKILDKYKRVDILVNNAGITRDNLLLRMTENDWDEVININLKGVFVCSKIVSKVMLKQHSGKIINISSIIGIIGNTGQTNYSASKAGIIGFTKSLAKEMASRGIRVNAVAPGYIQTDMTAELNEKTREDLLKKIPLGTLGTTQDVASACVFLASADADYITGQTIVVDGGMAI